MNILAALNSNSSEYLSNPSNVNFVSLNMAARGLYCREIVKQSPLFDLLCDRYNNLFVINQNFSYCIGT